MSHVTTFLALMSHITKPYVEFKKWSLHTVSLLGLGGVDGIDGAGQGGGGMVIPFIDQGEGTGN